LTGEHPRTGASFIEENQGASRRLLTEAKPFVSILIDTYNHEKFIEQAIVSALDQDFPAAEREIIVVDDGSSDGTPDLVRKFEPIVLRHFRTWGSYAPPHIKR
jgi:cellulose synthase/poly-beta-1,6-N-acetylglucosamine synthase-like glycosyltransferase